MCDANKIIPTNVIDVKKDHYILKTCSGDIFKLPTGTVPLEDKQLIGINEDTYLQILLPNIDDDLNESEELIYETTSTAVLSESEKTTNVEKKTNAEWSDKSTKLLIHQYTELKPLVENRKIKTMKRMWEKIAEVFMEHGLQYTTVQIESKWKTLERSFKATIDNSKKTGRGKRSCPYQRELAEILLQRDSVIPPCVLDEKNTRFREDVVEETGLNELYNTPENINSVNDTSLSSTPTSTTARQRNQELRLLAEAIVARTNLKKETEIKKFDQRERLIAAINERNEILRSLVSRNNIDPNVL